MTRRPNTTPEQIEQILALRKQGKTYQQIADVMKIHKAACYYWVNTDSLNTKRRYNKRRNREVRPQGSTKVTHCGPTPPLEVPPDTRTPIQKHFGDPLPGRSALDMKKEQENAPDTSKPSDPFRTPPTDKDAARGSR